MVNLKMLLWITLSTLLSFIVTANQLRYSPDELYRLLSNYEPPRILQLHGDSTSDQGPFTVDLSVTTAVVAAALGLFANHHKFALFMCTIMT